MRLPLLILHITGGIVGILSGAAAMTFRKGYSRHRVAGLVFVVSMLCMASAGAYLAFVKHQMNNVVGGVITFYMVTTGWLTGRRKEGTTGILDWGMILFALTVAAFILTAGVKVALGTPPPPDAPPVGMYFFMGGVALLSAAGDVRMLAHGGLSGRPRLVRHLWRMCFGLFIATGSFFLGQQQVFPVWLRGSYLLLFLGLLPLPLMIYWLIRVRFTKAEKANGWAADRPVPSLSTSIR